jgi:cysteine-rich repeat protein
MHQPLFRQLARLAAAAAALLAPLPAAAEPIGHGSFVAVVTPDGRFCTHGPLANQTYEAFGAQINLGSTAGQLSLWGQLDTVAQTGTLTGSALPDGSQLHVEGNLAYDASNLDAVPFTSHALDVLTGIPFQALTNVVYSFDGVEACTTWDGVTTAFGCPYAGPYSFQCSGTISFNAFRRQATPTGADVTIDSSVSYYDVTTGATTEIGVGVNFDEVYGTGSTTVTAVSDTTGTIPQTFAIDLPGLPATFFDVTTSAQFVGPIEICTNYDDADDDGIVDGTDVPEGRLRLLHGEGDPRVFVDRTSRLDTDANLVCAEVPSLSFFVRAVSACGNGTIDSGEQCDDAQDTPADGDGCSASCQIESCYSCGGSPSSCTPNTDPCDDGNACTTGDVCSGGVCSGSGGSGSPCDDGNDCTDGDQCSDGVCSGAPLDGTSCDDGNACTDGETCSAGTCASPSAACDDADPCTTDACNPASGCVHGDVYCAPDADPCTQDVCLAGLGCGNYETPADSCKEAGKSSLQIKQNSDDSKDALKWKWNKGVDTQFTEITDPTQNASYDLCIYDASGIVASATVAPGGTCNDKACWVAGRKQNYVFKDRAGSQDGITRFEVAAGSVGKAKASVQGKGVNLPDATLPLAGGVTVQLRNRSTEACFGSSYAGEQIRKNDAAKGAFSAKAP